MGLSSSRRCSSADQQAQDLICAACLFTGCRPQATLVSRSAAVQQALGPHRHAVHKQTPVKCRSCAAVRRTRLHQNTNPRHRVALDIQLNAKGSCKGKCVLIAEVHHLQFYVHA